MPESAMRPIWGLAILCCLSSAQAAESDGKTYTTPDEAAADPGFAVQGEYAAEGMGVQVVALGQGKFSIVTFTGGLPGDGWDQSERKVSEVDAAGVKEVIANHKLKKVERESGTNGEKPPEGAVVLFDGSEESLKEHWRDGAKIDEDGLLMPGVTSKENFQDFKIHIEFRLPYMPEARGQGRGNSGYYLQGRYEVQMLDSFGLEGLDNECGGIYSVSKPDVNMCYPPLAWQTYDAEFTAARFDDQGKKTAAAHVKLWHNGVLIHDRDLHQTPGGPLTEETPEPGPVYLQDHGNPVRYRNIWIVPR
jgi:hypothetical protein